MPKLNDLGESGLRCQPKFDPRSRASQKTLFQPMPERQLVPSGNAAYEGVGYPAAGYGQSRRQVVPLALPQKANPQLVGWDGKQPQAKAVTIFTLNPNSGLHTRAEVAALAGLGTHATQVDRNFGKMLNGLSQNLTMVQQLANAIATGVVPDSTLAALTDKLIADEKANTAAYANIAKLRTIDPQSRDIETLTRAQQTAWGQTNTAKFYALLIPEMQRRLGFDGGTPKVTPPDYKYIKAGDPGVFTKVADMLRDAVVGKAAQGLITSGYMKDSTGLAGLGIWPVVLGAVATTLVAAGIIAYMVSNISAAAEANSKAAMVASCASGKVSKAACAAALAPDAKTDWNSIAMYGAVGIGGLVLLQVISSVRAAFPTR